MDAGMGDMEAGLGDMEAGADEMAAGAEEMPADDVSVEEPEEAPLTSVGRAKR